MSTKFAFAAGIAALVLSTPLMAQDIAVTDAYARSATAKAKSGAAFLVIENQSAENDRLISVSTPAAARAQLHTHEENDMGMMSMRHVEAGFDLPAGGMIMMTRGGDHVMLLGLNEPFEQGATIPITLVFEVAGEITVDVEVDHERKPGMAHGHSHATTD